MSLFPAIDEMLTKAKNLSEEKAWIFVIDEEVKRELIRLNTKDQMFDKGIDSLNKSLGVYSKRSVEVFGKRKGRIQLKDTGEFYDSFVIRVTKSGLVIEADTLKVSDKGVDDLAAKYGIDILGLTDDNLDKLIREYLIDNYRDFIINEIL